MFYISYLYCFPSKEKMLVVNLRLTNQTNIIQDFVRPHLGFDPASLQLRPHSAVVHGIVVPKHAAEEAHAVRVVQRMAALRRPTPHA